MAEDIAFNKLRPSLVAAAIEAMRHTKISLYVHGAPGIAKSAVARQVADKLGIAFIDVRLSQMAPEDLRGVPVLGEIDGMKGVLWSSPFFWPHDLDYFGNDHVNGTKTIHFFNPISNNGIHYCTTPRIEVVGDAKITDRQLDRFTVEGDGAFTWKVNGEAKAIVALEELNSAPPSVMAAAYQLIHGRRLGDYMVPDGVMLLAMGNRDGDKGVTFKLPKPLANRFIHIEMIDNIEDFIDHGARVGMHPVVIGYLARWPSKLLDFNPSLPTHSFPTPRSWEMVSTIMYQLAPNEVKRALVHGAIGSAAATEFLLQKELMDDMPDAKTILDGTTTTFRPKNPQHATQIAYSTAVQIVYLLKEQNDLIRQKSDSKQIDERSPERKEWYRQANRAVGYMMEFFAPEVCVVALRMALLTHGLRFSSEHMPHYVTFTKRNRDLFF
jgi:hypothetical protein